MGLDHGSKKNNKREREHDEASTVNIFRKERMALYARMSCTESGWTRDGIE